MIYVESLRFSAPKNSGVVDTDDVAEGTASWCIMIEIPVSEHQVPIATIRTFAAQEYFNSSLL